MRKISLVCGSLLAALVLSHSAVPANAAAPSVSYVTAVVGQADRNRGIDEVYHPVIVTVRVQGTSLGTSSTNSAIYLTGWHPRYGEVRKIARRVRSNLGRKDKGNEVLEWAPGGAFPDVVVVFDVSRLYRDSESIEEFISHIGDLRIDVKTPEGRTGPVPIDLAFRYDRWPINQSPSPIALAEGDNGDVYINFEVNPVNPSVWRKDTGQVQEIAIPQTEGLYGPFGNSDDENTYVNGNGQSVAFGDERAWFGQSANWVVATPTVQSQSRIVSYKPGGTPEIKKYIVSADDEPIMGVLYDSDNDRIWYSLADRKCPGSVCAGGIGSIPVDGHPEESFSAIPTPIRLPGTVYPAMMAFDKTSERNLWFTTMDANYLGRIQMTPACLADPEDCTVDRYSLPQTYNRNLFQEMGWSIDGTDDGDIVFNLYFETALARFDVDGNDTSTDGAEDLDCKVGVGDSDAANPCMSVVQVPLVAPTNSSSEAVHSMALDRDRCLMWYSYYAPSGALYRNNSIGFAPVSLAGGTQGMTTLPALYGFENHSGNWAVTAFSGIMVSSDGSVFFTDFYRSKLGRITPIDSHMIEHCP